jgi:hypothetical protein
MKNLLVGILSLVGSLSSFSQLLPTIGSVTKPADAATLCIEPFYLGNFYTSGFQQGNAVPDFKLYGLNGDSLVLSQALSSGKPVLLIAGSLTCPVFRSKVPVINQVVATYSNNIKVYVIYTLEAHPTDTSVYFGYVNVTSQNTSAGILFPQPTTYGLRKKMVDTMSTWVNLNAPVFIDGPCDQWWKNFGPAPNNSYLISPNGMVLNKHGWFHNSPDNIFCDLDSILNINSGLCIPAPTVPGTFSINVRNSSVTGTPGKVLYDYLDLVNTSSVVTDVKIKKLQKSLPSGWQSAFCADVCYGMSEDSIEISIAANDTLHFSLDFFSTSLPDSGSVRLGFKNKNKSNNNFSMRLMASTILNDVSIAVTDDRPSFKSYPSPSDNAFRIISNDHDYQLAVYDLFGNKVYSAVQPVEVKTEAWPDGVYGLIYTVNGNVLTRKIIVKH